ncbi:PREDICTED: uncharacterized protein C14orf79 homolog [Galeopterus variegatus]|uniref:Uncharacterized protein C14orf79 homolog n=1 Tax=Galeopterus variegatus TaxID=482537 RepID=A0ABM0QVV6_GALVR|nr:PREDICTED: uncharacterized protein C14orf79 homolog [Galeopterus variegatus]
MSLAPPDAPFCLGCPPGNGHHIRRHVQAGECPRLLLRNSLCFSSQPAALPPIPPPSPLDERQRTLIPRLARTREERARFRGFGSHQDRRGPSSSGSVESRGGNITQLHRQPPAGCSGVRTRAAAGPEAATGERRSAEERAVARVGAARRCPDPGEHSSAWGEFEGFRESSAKSEQFSRSLGLLERPAPAPEERGSPQPQPGGVTGAAALPPSQPILSYENIFKFAFQEITVQQSTEDVSTLDHFLEISGEKSDLASVHKLCSESRKLWRALQSTDTTSASRHLWSESRCQENYFLVLGIDAAQKILSGGQGHILEGSSLKEPEELLAVGSFRLHHCRALVQTTLSGTPGSRHGSLITYSLFLKTPLQGNRQHITIPRKKKIFTPRNLKMMFFNSDVC